MWSQQNVDAWPWALFEHKQSVFEYSITLIEINDISILEPLPNNLSWTIKIDHTATVEDKCLFRRRLQLIMPQGSDMMACLVHKLLPLNTEKRMGA